MGSHSVVAAGAIVGPLASIEQNCVVDCGTTVERATILPFTYLSPGLLIRDAQVDGGNMVDVTRETAVDLKAARLASNLSRSTANRGWVRASQVDDREKAFPAPKPPTTWWEAQL